MLTMWGPSALKGADQAFHGVAGVTLSRTRHKDPFTEVSLSYLKKHTQNTI